MKLIEFEDKLIELKNDSKNANKEVRIFLEDDYNNIDIIVDKIENEDDAIFLS